MNKIKTRYYFNSTINNTNEIKLDYRSTHHFINVLRGKVADYINLFNENDGEYTTEVVIATKNNVTVKVVEHFKNPIKNNKKITLYFAPLKKDAMDFLLHKSTEIGVDNFIPIITERTIGHQIKQKIKEEIIIDAVEQSNRLSIPTVFPIIKLYDIKKPLNGTIMLFADEKRDCKNILTTMNAINIDEVNEIAIIIGPEGGFSEKEREFLIKTAIPVSLGNNILKAETAAIASLSVIIMSLY